MSAIRQIMIDMLKAEGNGDCKWVMTNTLMHWGQVGMGYGSVDEEVYEYRELWELADDINNNLMVWSQEICAQIWLGLKHNTPITVDKNYWSDFCKHELNALDRDILNKSFEEVMDEIDVCTQLWEEFLCLSNGQKMDIISQYLLDYTMPDWLEDLFVAEGEEIKDNN